MIASLNRSVTNRVTVRDSRVSFHPDRLTIGTSLRDAQPIGDGVLVVQPSRSPDSRSKTDNNHSGDSDTLVASAGNRRAVSRQPLVHRFVPYKRKRSVDIVHQWECKVTGVDRQSQTIELELRDLIDQDRAQEFGEIAMRELPPNERECIAPGDVLYWMIGYERDKAGTYRRVSEFRRKRMPKLNRTMAARIAQETQKMAEAFGCSS